MAGNNQFYPVATGAGANVLTPASWGASPVRQSGFQSGIAPSSGFNTAWRQSSVIASMVGSFIASAGYDALDNGDLTTLLVNFQSAVAAVAQSGIPGSTALLHSGTDTSSTVNQIALTSVSPDVPALQDFQVYEVVPAITNTGAVTLTVKTFASLPLLKRNGGQLASGDALAGVPVLVVKYGSAFRMLSAAPSEISSTAVTIINNLKIAGGTPNPFPTAGTYTLTVAANTTFSVFECRGGGGGGGGAAGTASAGCGGGGGGVHRLMAATATVSTVLSIVVGSGGSPGSAGGGNGTAGGTSSISVQSGSVQDVKGNIYTAGQTLCAATGGGGGQGASGTSTGNQPSPGGMASGSGISDSGDSGGLPQGQYTNNTFLGGLGGGSPGSGGSPGANQGAGGNSSGAPGVGGNGSSNNATGGTGAPGRIVVYM